MTHVGAVSPAISVLPPIVQTPVADAPVSAWKAEMKGEMCIEATGDRFEVTSVVSSAPTRCVERSDGVAFESYVGANCVEGAVIAVCVEASAWVTASMSGGLGVISHRSLRQTWRGCVFAAMSPITCCSAIGLVPSLCSWISDDGRGCLLASLLFPCDGDIPAIAALAASKGDAM